ncbi:CidA/LrgA family holin-like protein [Sporosarcina sp. ANT_H38]|uniref:CidA/LrgA family holin-like protein n=1 Tax=Sporosarcina sp. ANT_H38 TaxID=2597358 RepID=UPI0011F38644|nr:CidA/LrgA family holin-like protein [Sporosarcina sp. ANT_H38]KAA0965454.1 CidA/LrgA family holin-like protein [Sporosarcina sp. ANT_H38]
MKYIKIVLQIIVLYSFVLLGNWLQDLLHLPLTGSIIGLLLLLAALSLKLFRLEWIESGSYFLLSYLPLYFIPATVGVMEYGHVFTGKGFLLIPITMISTFLTMWISSYTSQALAKKSAGKGEASCK